MALTRMCKVYKACGTTEYYFKKAMKITGDEPTIEMGRNGKVYFIEESKIDTLATIAKTLMAERHPQTTAFTSKKRVSPTLMDCGTTGAKTEMVASIYLFNQGYHVYRSLSPSGICDLIAVKDSVAIRVEVKTGYLNSKSGANVRYTMPMKKANRFDMLIIVTYEDGFKMAIFNRKDGVDNDKGGVVFSMRMDKLIGTDAIL